MEGCLEGHEADSFHYGIKANPYIAVKKNGKTYLHFYSSIRSSSITMEFFPSFPKTVRLMNTGKKLDFSLELLPEYFSAGRANPYLHITGIPIDALANEPIVIEITWQDASC